MNTGRREVARRKLLKILPRNKLEELSNMDKPGNANIPFLISAAADPANWDSDEVKTAINNLFKRADSEQS